MMNINNMPRYAENYDYIVARRVDGEYWFWGAWNDRDRANEVALEEGCVVFRNEHQSGRSALELYSLSGTFFSLYNIKNKNDEKIFAHEFIFLS